MVERAKAAAITWRQLACALRVFAEVKDPGFNNDLEHEPGVREEAARETCRLLAELAGFVESIGNDQNQLTAMVVASQILKEGKNVWQALRSSGLKI